MASNGNPVVVRAVVPGDKSITHRALLLAALSSGRCELRRPLVGADTRSTAAALRALGCVVSELGESCVIEGVGLHGLQAPGAVLDCGNSGTTARLLMGALAGHAFSSTLTGDESLRSRPMRRVMDPLSLMGASFRELEQPDRLPVTVHGGALRPLQYESPHASAQVKTAILLAGLAGSADVRVTEPVRSRDHTERMLAHIGVPLLREAHADGSASVMLRPVPAMEPFDLEVPGDISSAAFIAALGALGGAGGRPVRICDVGLNPTRTGFLRVLQRMGARVETGNVRESCGEPLGDLTVHAGPLSGTRVTAEEVPSLIDELPVIAVLAARAEGETHVAGAAELRVKETDRIQAIVSNLTAIGAEAEEREDGFVVRGSTRPLKGHVSSYGDHRIAMAFGVLGGIEGADIHVGRRDIVEVSFPGFWELVAALAAEVGE